MNVSNHTSKQVPKSGDKNRNFSSNTFSDWGIIKHGVSQGSSLGSFFFST
jgi:hypothetical protein